MTPPKPTPTPPESPSASTPEAKPNLRERVKTFTDRELEGLMDDFEAKRGVVEELHEEETKQAVDQRMEELKVADTVKARWQTLRASIKPAPSGKIAEMQKKAEESFLKKMVEKGGLTAVLASAGISILAWLGFSSAKALRSSIKEKGYLRTVIEGAKEHPIFAALIAAMGIKVGSDAYHYMQDNRDAIEGAVGEYATKTGKGIAGAISSVTTMALNGADYLKNQSVRALAKGLSIAFGGNYDEATGVVTIENKLLGGQKTLRPPFITVWQAGIRSKGGTAMMKNAYSLFLVQDRFDAILRQKNLVDAHVRAADAGLFLSAKRGKELLEKGVRPGLQTKESLELEQIMDLAIKADPVLQKAQPLDSKQASKVEIEDRLKHVEDQMKKFYEQEEIPAFKNTKDAIHNKALTAERNLNDPAMKGKEDIKKNAFKEIQTDVAAYEATIEQKVSLAHQKADLMTAQSQSDLLGEHLQHKLDQVEGGKGLVTKGLNKGVETAESWGCKIIKNRAGKWIVGTVGCYSLMPLALEGVAGLQSGKEGEKARKALTNDVGEAVGGFIPGVGEVLDFRAAVMGKDLNGRELDTWSRVTAGTMGTLGSAAIAAGFFTGGTTIVGFQALRGFLASRKALKMIKLAKEGVDIAGVTKDTLKTIEVTNVVGKTVKSAEQAKQSAKALDEMLVLTETQRKARGVQNFIHNGQRAVQLYTYGSLGLQLVSGFKNIYDSGGEFVNDTVEKAAGGLKTIGDFANNYGKPAEKA